VRINGSLRVFECHQCTHAAPRKITHCRPPTHAAQRTCTRQGTHWRADHTLDRARLVPRVGIHFQNSCGTTPGAFSIPRTTSVHNQEPPAFAFVCRTGSFSRVLQAAYVRAQRNYPKIIQNTSAEPEFCPLFTLTRSVVVKTYFFPAESCSAHPAWVGWYGGSSQSCFSREPATPPYVWAGVRWSLSVVPCFWHQVIVHVAFCAGKWKPDLTLTLSANELSHLKHQPTRCDNPVENPEEQVHWPLTRRAAPPQPVLYPLSSLLLPLTTRPPPPSRALDGCGLVSVLLNSSCRIEDRVTKVYLIVWVLPKNCSGFGAWTSIDPKPCRSTRGGPWVLRRRK